MMGRSHALIGLATVTALAAANFWPLSPAVLAATAIGSLALTSTIRNRRLAGRFSLCPTR